MTLNGGEMNLDSSLMLVKLSLGPKISAVYPNNFKFPPLGKVVKLIQGLQFDGGTPLKSLSATSTTDKPYTKLSGHQVCCSCPLEIRLPKAADIPCWGLVS